MNTDIEPVPSWVAYILAFAKAREREFAYRLRRNGYKSFGDPSRCVFRPVPLKLAMLLYDIHYTEQSEGIAHQPHSLDHQQTATKLGFENYHYQL
jgi:hypothetical protein